MTIICIVVTALSTYIIRALPLTLVRKKINNRYIISFLHYIPYACLTAMTFPAILYATQSLYSAVAGLVVAVIVALLFNNLITVAACACITVFLTELIIK